MKTTKTALTLLSLAVVALAGAAPGLASEPQPEKKKKCTATADACIHSMSEGLRKKGWVGIEMRETDEKSRPVVTGIVEDSPAQRAGFELGDVLAAFNGVGTTEGEEMVNAEVKRSMTPGNTITITVLRRSRPVDLEVTLGRIPDYLLAQWIGYHMLEGHGEDAVAETPRP